MGDFDRDTRVESLGEGRYRATPHPDWKIWGPNGGYIAAIALRAAGAEARLVRPSSFTCHFVSVARFEPVEIEVEVLRAGQRAELIRASMRQGDRLIVETLLRTAQEGPGLEHDMASPPAVPHFDELPCVDDLLPKDGFRHPFWSNVEARHPDPSRVGKGPSARPPDRPTGSSGIASGRGRCSTTGGSTPAVRCCCSTRSPGRQRRVPIPTRASSRRASTSPSGSTTSSPLRSGCSSTRHHRARRAV